MHGGTLNLTSKPSTFGPTFEPSPCKQVKKETSTPPSMSIRSIVDVILKPILEPTSTRDGMQLVARRRKLAISSRVSTATLRIQDTNYSTISSLCFWLLFFARPLLMTA
jgi:hypothetical protein